jgi:hypothetical protein
VLTWRHTALFLRDRNHGAERHRLDAGGRGVLRDPDRHRLEYLAMLDEKPRPDRGIVSWSQWTS